MSIVKQEIVDDIRRVARNIGLKPGDELGMRDYLNNGAQFSDYQIWEGGMTWSAYCTKAGYKPKIRTEFIPDEIYFARLQEAINQLGRFPKASERKKFKLNFNIKRWPTLRAFIEDASSHGKVRLPASLKIKPAAEKPKEDNQAPKEEHYEVIKEQARAIPPIPQRTRRKKWERTGIEGFPYAPQDESGVIALFSILCAKGIIQWQILEFNKGKGIDTVCWDDQEKSEFKVELKYILSRANWNHPFDSFDRLVCWENRWHDFPKPVLELRSLLKKVTNE